MHSEKYTMKRILPFNPIGLFLTVCFFLLLSNISSGQTIIGVSDIDLKKTQKYYVEKGHHKFLSSGLTPGHYNSAPCPPIRTFGTSESFQKYSTSQIQVSVFGQLTVAIIPFLLEAFYPAADISPAFFNRNVSVLQHQYEVDLFVLHHSWKSHLS